MIHLNSNTNKIEIENEINIEKLKDEIKKICNHNKCIKINDFHYPFPVYECRKCFSSFAIHQNKVYEFKNIGFFHY
jgi:hypothetical protein